MTSPGPAFQECTGSCHGNVPAPKAVSSQSGIDRWSDCIGQDRDSRHLGTLLTTLQHFTIPWEHKIHTIRGPPVFGIPILQTQLPELQKKLHCLLNETQFRQFFSSFYVRFCHGCCCQPLFLFLVPAVKIDLCGIFAARPPRQVWNNKSFSSDY